MVKQNITARFSVCAMELRERGLPEGQVAFRRTLRLLSGGCLRDAVSLILGRPDEKQALGCDSVTIHLLAKSLGVCTDMDFVSLRSFAANNWGSLASIVGLGVSIWTLIVASGARKAARDAKREARRQKLIEGLQNAVYRVEQLGHHVLLKKWEISFIRAQEVSSSCSLILRRWADSLTEISKDRILLAQAQAVSIVKAAMKASSSPPTEQQLQRIVTAQQRAFELLSSEKGESLGAIERGD